MNVRIAGFFLLFLIPLSTVAQDLGYYEKPINGLKPPLSEPVDVEIHIEQTSLFYRESNYAGLGISPLGDEIAKAMFESKERKHIEPVMAELRASMPATDHGLMLEKFLRKHLEESGLLRIGNIRIYGATHPAPAPDATDATRQVMIVRAAYYMSPLLREFRVALDARHGARKTLMSATPVKPGALFSQRFYYDVGVGNIGRLYSLPNAASYWKSVGGDNLAEHAIAGLEDTVRMLAYEIQRSPRFGRIAGKQYGWGEGQYSTYGAVESQQGDRIWLRLRDGRLASIATR